VRYLNAILTNNIKDLDNGRGIVSLFLTPQGRIQAEIETYAEAESLFCVSYVMIRETLAPALDKFIIMDDVTLADETETYGTLALEGPKAAALAQKLTGIALGTLSELSFQEKDRLEIQLEADAPPSTRDLSFHVYVSSPQSQVEQRFDRDREFELRLLSDLDSPGVLRMKAAVHDLKASLPMSGFRNQKIIIRAALESRQRDGVS
jgi:folate-binding Fe-S cluster repair protein YgfZ